MPPRLMPLASLLGRREQQIDLPRCLSLQKTSALRTMSQHFLERSEPLASAILHRPVEVVQLSASAWPSRLFHHRSGQRTNHQRTDSFRSPASIASLRCDLRRYDRYPTRVRLRCDLCARVRLPAQGAYHRPSLELSSVQVISSSCASMNQVIERSSLFQPASTRSIQNSQHTICSYSEDGVRAMKRR